MIISRSCLSACYNWLLPLLNPVPGPRLNTPSVRLILDVLTNSPSECWGEKIDYIRTLVQQLSALLIDANGLLDADRGFEINQDIFAKDTNCVIHCADFGPPYLKYLIYDLLMTQCTSYLMHNQLKTNQTKRIIACEEGEFMVSHQAQAAYGDSLSPNATSARLLREYGVQLVIVASAPQHIDPFLVKSTDCVLTHCCVDPESIWYIRRMFMLEPECDKLLPALKPGQCIYREAQGPFPYPILGQIDLLEPDHASKAGTYDSLPFMEARDLEDLPEVQEALKDRIRERAKTTLRQSHARQEKPSSLLNANERTFLDYLSLHEYEPVHRIFTRMDNPAPATQKRILDSLAQEGLIWSEQIKTARTIRIACPTEAGWQYLNKQSRFSPLRGGRVHSFVCRWKQALDLKLDFEESTCECHYPNSSGIGDVCSKRNGKLYFTEVVIACDANVDKHARSCFLESDQVESLTIVTLLKSEHEAIRTMILSDPELVFCISRISFVTVDQILKELYNDESR